MNTDNLILQGVLLAKQNNLSQWTEHHVAVYQNGGIRTQITNKKNNGADHFHV